MMPEQLINLFEFTGIFLSGDLDILKQSPDYILEKYDKIIGVDIKINEDISIQYIAWKNTWGENKKVNSIFLFFEHIIMCDGWIDNKYDHWLTYITIEQFKSGFKKYIGYINNINDHEHMYNCLHFILKDNLTNVFIKRNQRYFKLLRVLSE
jgi:hypothetical protein